MHLFKHLWQWLQDRHIERRGFKGHMIGKRALSQDTPPLAHSTNPDADALRLRLRTTDPGPRIM